MRTFVRNAGHFYVLSLLSFVLAVAFARVGNNDMGTIYLLLGVLVYAIASVRSCASK